MVALVQPESSRDSGSPQRFIFNTQKNNHLEIAETCADPQITSTQPAARHNQPGQNACAHTRFERKEKGKNKIQHPGIKDWQILSVTTQPRKGREKRSFSVPIVQEEQRPSAFQVKADEPAENCCVIEESWERFQSMQWRSVRKNNQSTFNTSRFLFLLPLPSSSSSSAATHQCLMQLPHQLPSVWSNLRSGQVQTAIFKLQITLNKELTCFQQWNK